jgi:hypothetical protein
MYHQMYILQACMQPYLHPTAKTRTCKNNPHVLVLSSTGYNFNFRFPNRTIYLTDTDPVTGLWVLVLVKPGGAWRE